MSHQIHQAGNKKHQKGICAFHGRPQGCRKGADCPFVHDASASSAAAGSGSSKAGAGADGPSWRGGAATPPATPGRAGAWGTPMGKPGTPRSGGSQSNAPMPVVRADEVVTRTRALLASPTLAMRGGQLFLSPWATGNADMGDAPHGGPVPQWRGYLDHYTASRSFAYQQQARKFVTGLLHSAHGAAAATDEVLLTLANHPATPDALDVLLTGPFSCDVGDRPQPLSFQRCLVPLLTFLSLGEVCNSVLTDPATKLLGLVKRHFGRWSVQYVQALEVLAARASVEDPGLGLAAALAQDPSALVPLTFVQVLLPLVRMLYELGCRFRDAAYSEDFFRIVEALERVITTVRTKLQAGALHTQVPDSPYGMEVVAREMGRVVDMVNHHRRQLGLSEILRAERAAAQQRQQLDANHPWAFAKTTPLQPPAKPDRRHEEILDITTPPYDHLPGNYQDYPHAHWLPYGPERLLDTHFRLLREDLVGPIRQSVTAFLAYLKAEGKGKGKRGKGDPAFGRDGRFRGVVQGAPGDVGSGESYQADLNVYSNAEVTGFQMRRRQGLCARIRFSLPPRLCNASPVQFRGHWERTRRFNQGALVCLLWWAGGDATHFQHVFGQVSEALPGQEGTQHATVVLHFPSDEALVPLIQSYQSATSEEGPAHPPTPHYIVEPNQLMFEAYRPILKALQTVGRACSACIECRGSAVHSLTLAGAARRRDRQMDPHTLPFTQYLCPADPDAHMTEGDCIVVQPSMYAKAENFYFDLSSICSGERVVFSPTSAASRTAAIASLRTASTLDQGQARALVHALSQEFACIQGPPGTGKSYVGVQLVRALLANRPRIGRSPILIICYTNHALDQFLEHLLDCGITNMARMGSRSNVERIQSLSLYGEVNHDRDRAARHAMWLERTEQERTEEEVGQLLASSGTVSKLHWSDVSAYLEASNFTHYLSMTTGGPADAYTMYKDTEGEEWQHQRGKGAPKDLLDRWLKAWDLHTPRVPSPPMAPTKLARRRGRGKAKRKEVHDGDKVGTEGVDEEEQQEEPPKAERSPLITQSRFAGLWELIDAPESSSVDSDASEEPVADAGAADEVGETQEDEDEGSSEDEEELVLIEHAMPETLTTEPEPARAVGERTRSTLDARHSDRPLTELLDLPDVWAMSRRERWRLFEHWRASILPARVQRFIHLAQRARESARRVSELHDKDQVKVLQRKQIIGVTTTACAKYQGILRAVGPTIVICEEAGETLESHILCSLHPGTQQLILIGDHEQLRPKLAMHALSQESREGKKYRLDLSLFERMQTQAYRVPVEQLAIQRRMRPTIANLIRRTLYPRLEDGADVQAYPPVRGMSHNLFFLHHEHPEDQAKHELRLNSHSNAFEVDMVIAMLRYLLRQGYAPEDVVILTPYVGQLMQIREKLRGEVIVLVDERDMREVARFADADADAEDDAAREGENGDAVGDAPNTPRDAPPKAREMVAERKTLGKCVRVSTVDNYQGEEAKIVLISTVRNGTGDAAGGSIGFLATSNRINVLLSRAQHGMYVLGNADLLARKSRMWREVVGMLREGGMLGPELPIHCANHPQVTQRIADPATFQLVAPEGGCTQPCGARLPRCGHRCRMLCHADLQSHLGVQCLEDCMRLHAPCEHPCTQRCWQPCGFCYRDVGDVMLPCGHVHPHTPCHRAQAPEAIPCNVLVRKVIPECGHEVELRCREDLSAISCRRACGVPLPGCGHPCTGECGACTDLTLDTVRAAEPVLPLERTQHPACQKRCDAPLVCKHRCTSICHQGQACPPCKQRCEIRVCPHSACRHQCSTPCQPCLEPCAWECEHQGKCPLACGAPCLRLPCDQRCAKLLGCGHRCPSVCGEPCPTDPWACRECSPDVRALQVDLVLFEAYEEVDLDADPVIVLRCGHIFTRSTLDGVLDLARVYTTAPGAEMGEGEPAYRLKPLPQEYMELPVCPTCRCPVRNVMRYGRICNRAMINLSEKQHLVESTARLLTLNQRYEGVVQKLDGRILRAVDELKAAADLWRPPAPAAVGRPGRARKDKKRRLTLPKEMQLQLSTFFKPLKELQHEANAFLHFAQRSPQREVYESSMVFLTNAGALDRYQVHLSLAKPPIGMIREGVKLKAQVFLHHFYHHAAFMRCLVAIPPLQALLRADCHRDLLDAVRLVEKCLQDLGTGVVDRSKCDLEMLLAELFLELLTFRRTTGQLDAGTLLKEVEEFGARWAEVRAALLPSFVYGNQERIDRLEGKLRSLQEPVYYTEVTQEEKRLIHRAMIQEFLGSGHWYTCPNGHTYTIGECGMPMELARCPECQADIGGTHHVFQAAHDLDEEFERMRL